MNARDIEALKLENSESLLRKYNWSISLLLTETYPSHPWEVWKFASGVAAQIWKNPTHQRRFMDHIEQLYGFRSKDDFYKISVKHFAASNGLGLLKAFSNSPGAVVHAVYPEHPWLQWRFHTVPRHWWTKKENQRAYTDWLFAHCGWTSPKDWYYASRADFESNSGVRLLNLYKNRLSELIKSIYPEHDWNDSYFFRQRKGLKQVSTQRSVFTEYAAKNGIKSLSGWYRADPTAVFADRAIKTMVSNYHDSSLVNALLEAFPTHEWKPWKFKRCPVGWWKEPANQRAFLDDAYLSLELKSMDDWYRVTVARVQRLGGASGIAYDSIRPAFSLADIGPGKSLIQLYENSLKYTLMTVYPEHPWDVTQFSARKRIFNPQLAPVVLGKRVKTITTSAMEK